MILALLVAATQFTTTDIDLRTSRDVAELLREAPGVVVERASETTLLLRGADPHHTRLLWNGIEIEEPYTRLLDLDRFSTAGVTRIEVSGGVVNLLTTSERTTARAVAEAGGDGLLLANGTASYVRQAHSATATVEMFRDDEGLQDDGDKRRNTAHALYRFALPAFSIGLTARAVQHERAALPLEESELHRDGNEWQLGVPIAQTLGRFSYELLLAQSQRDDETRQPALMSSVESTTRRARFVTRYAGLTAGVEHKSEEASETTDAGPFVEDAQQNATALFVEQQLARTIGAARFEATAGLRYDHYDTFGRALSPRLMLAYSTRGNTIHAGYAEAFRPPALRELYDPFQGEESLEAEESRTIELGYARGPFRVTAFSSNYDNRIDFDLTRQRYENFGEAEVRGLELGYARTFGVLTTRLSYTHLDTDLVGRPRNSGSLFLGYSIGRLRANAVVVAGTDTDLAANLQYDLGAFTPYVKVEEYQNERRLAAGVRFGVTGFGLR